MLQTRDLQVGYDKHLVIQELNLTIPPAKITALVGGNGSGKSTLLKAMARILKPSDGAVLLDGKSLSSIPTREVATRLGLLPQAPVAPEGMQVRELVAQGRYPHQRWMQAWSAADERAVNAALAATEMTELADRPLESLSGGQRQRAWIAMALAQETPILLLDEPTTYLDMAHQIDVLELLAELNYKHQRTIVMVLHDLNQASRYAHHLIAVKDGRVVAEGDPAQIMTVEMVESVFGLPCCIITDPIAGTPMCIPVCRGAAAAAGLVRLGEK